MLRGYHLPVASVIHRHSSLAFQLRADVLDSKLRFDAALANMQSWCSLHGHPQADLSGTVRILKGLFADALSEIPYMTGGKSGDELQNADRNEAIQKYREYRDRVMKKDSKKPDASVKPKVANKHKA